MKSAYLKNGFFKIRVPDKNLKKDKSLLAK